jgi:threonylcarbamoyladenosine tRNA methylthiotransferase MtaB
MPDGAQLPRTFEVVTFGCRLNARESESMEAWAETLGETVVFNTCAVTGEAVRQARQAIRKARRERPDARLIVTGCAAQIDPAQFAAMPEVDQVLGNAEKTQGPLAEARISVGDIMTRPPEIASARRLRARARAYVQIQNGCDHRCTFCVIPYGRGPSRSRDVEAVIAETRAAVAAGAREIVLTGVDLTSWGADLAEAPPLGRLVAEILRAVPELYRLRLSSIDAAEIDAELRAVIAAEPRLAPHLHLSLQAGDDLILKRMKRRHSRTQALDLIADLRVLRPDMAFGADVIAGFPTESEAAAENTRAFVAEAGLSYLHVFPYSPRPGTPAARMPQVPGAVIRERAARLRAVGEDLLAAHLQQRVGRRIEALVEAPGRARAADFTELRIGVEAAPGTVVAGVMADHDGRTGRLENGSPLT